MPGSWRDKPFATLHVGSDEIGLPSLPYYLLSKELQFQVQERWAYKALNHHGSTSLAHALCSQQFGHTVFHQLPHRCTARSHRLAPLTKPLT